MSLSGKTIVFTGTLTMKRADATKAAEAAGAKVSGSVSGNTDILVAGPGAGAKEAQAKAKGVDVWSEAQFVEALGGSTSEPAPAAGKGKKKAAPEPEEEAPPAKKQKAGKGKAKEETSTAPATPTKAASAAGDAPTPGLRTPGVDRAARSMSGVSVYLDYDAKLNQAVTDGPVNSNKFYIVQVLQRGSLYAVWNRWGRVGEEGQNNLNKLSWGSAEAAVKDFEKKYVHSFRTLNGKEYWEQSAC